MKKKMVSLVLTFCLIAVSLVFTPATCSAADKANFLTLGDSIAAGTTLSNPKTQCYSAIVANAMNAQLTNEAVSGLNSTELLAQLTGDSDTVAEVKAANVITISIGSNDVLAPFLSYVAQALGCSSTEEVTKKLQTMMANADLVGFANFQAAMEVSLKADSTNENGIAAGIQTFAKNYPQIIQKIREYNPTAEVYVTNVYNPLKGIALGTFDVESLGATYITKLNEVITAAATTGSYSVVDLYKAFHASSAQLINAKVDLASGVCNMDPHPTLLGHKTIASLLERSMIAQKATCAAALLSKKGATTIANGLTLTVTAATAATRTVTVTKANSNTATITIPATVTINGYSYKVTKVAAKAFYHKSKIKTIICKSTTLTSVGVNALKGIHANAVVKVPNTKLAAYKKLFANKGAKVTVKAM